VVLKDTRRGIRNKVDNSVRDFTEKGIKEMEW
jgi:hypothetical protein